MTDLTYLETNSESNGLSRRRFMKTMGTGLVLGFVLPTMGGRVLGLIHEAEAATLDTLEPDATTVNAWIRIVPAAVQDSETIVELLFGGCEMGQGTMTGLSQMLAEELKINWQQIVIKRPDISAYATTFTTTPPPSVYAYPLDETGKPVAVGSDGKPATTPYASTYFSSPTKMAHPYGTGGSSGISRRWDSLRMAGAQARELLVAIAMNLANNSTRSSFTVKDGLVSNGTDSWSFSHLALQLTQKNLNLSTLAAGINNFDNKTLLTDTRDLIGQPMTRPDIPLKTCGAAKFGIDITNADMPQNLGLKKMLFAAVKHCPTVGGFLSKTPAKPAAALALVPLKVFVTRGAVVKDTVNAFAVVADNTWKANRLVASVSASWTLPSNKAAIDSNTIKTVANNRLANPGVNPIWIAEPGAPTSFTNGGQTTLEQPVLDAFNRAPIQADVTFGLPYVAHATMEVMNCTVVLYPDPADTTKQKCEIWAPTQNAASVISTALSTLGWTDTTAAQRVVVHTTFLGGGLGRKIEQDYISQAIQVAAALPLTPVKLTWFREQDFANDQYRPMAQINVKAGLNGSALAAWFYRVATPSISTRGGAVTKMDGQAVEGAFDLPYALGSFITEWIPLESAVAGIPVGYWRSVGCSLNTFAVESMMDILAGKAGIDPFVFRRDLIQAYINTQSDATRIANANRFLVVLNAADLKSATWRNSLPTGHAWGVAIARAFNTIVCEVVEVSQPVVGALTIHRVDCVIDCGIAVNPNAVEAQMQGGIIHGLNATLWGRTTFTNGVTTQTNFKTNRMLRLNETPAISVQIMQNNYSPTGTGEPAVPPIAAAVANAHARLPNATRQTTLPFFPTATMSGL